jgi:hypothetical protein
MPRRRWSEQQMREFLREQETSGVSLKEFAAAAEISCSTLSWWRSRLRRDETPRFVPVRVQDKDPRVEIVVGDVVVRVADAADAAPDGTAVGLPGHRSLGGHESVSHALLGASARRSFTRCFAVRRPSSCSIALAMRRRPSFAYGDVSVSISISSKASARSSRAGCSTPKYTRYSATSPGWM